MTALFRRELLIGLRRGAPYALLAVNALLLAGVAAAVGALSGSISPWVAPTIGSTSAPTPSGLGATLVAWRGPALFFLLTLWLALLATVVAPTTGAHALARERRAGVLPTLIGSGVGVGSLVLAKAAAALLQVMLVLLSGAPAFALVWLFGGVAPRALLLATGLLVGYTLFLVTLGMLLAALLPGELLPSGAGVFVGSTLLLILLVVYLAGALSGQSLRVAPLGVVAPAVALLGANHDFAEALARAAPGSPTLPLQPTLTLLGRTIAAPTPFWTGLGYGLLGLLLVPFAAAALDPYHPLKTWRLRRAARAGAVA